MNPKPETKTVSAYTVLHQAGLRKILKHHASLQEQQFVMALCFGTK